MISEPFYTTTQEPLTTPDETTTTTLPVTTAQQPVTTHRQQHLDTTDMVDSNSTSVTHAVSPIQSVVTDPLAPGVVTNAVAQDEVTSPGVITDAVQSSTPAANLLSTDATNHLADAANLSTDATPADNLSTNADNLSTDATNLLEFSLTTDSPNLNMSNSISFNLSTNAPTSTTDRYNLITDANETTTDAHNNNATKESAVLTTSTKLNVNNESTVTPPDSQSTDAINAIILAPEAAQTIITDYATTMPTTGATKISNPSTSKRQRTDFDLSTTQAQGLSTLSSIESSASENAILITTDSPSVDDVTSELTSTDSIDYTTTTNPLTTTISDVQSSKSSIAIKSTQVYRFCC